MYIDIDIDRYRYIDIRYIDIYIYTHTPQHTQDHVMIPTVYAALDSTARATALDTNAVGVMLAIFVCIYSYIHVHDAPLSTPTPSV